LRLVGGLVLVEGVIQVKKQEGCNFVIVCRKLMNEEIGGAAGVGIFDAFWEEGR